MLIAFRKIRRRLRNLLVASKRRSANRVLCSESLEPRQLMAGDTPSTLARAVNLGSVTKTAIVRSDSVSPADDIDMYKFTARAGQRIGIDIDTIFNGPLGLGSYLRIFDSQGRALAYNNDRLAPGDPPPARDAGSAGFDSYIDYTFSTGGEYYVGVTNWQNRVYNPISGKPALGSDSRYLTGEYTLVVADLSPPVDLKLKSASWNGLSATGKSPAALIQLGLEVNGASGNVAVRIYQSNNSTLEKSTDQRLSDTTVSVTGNSSQLRVISLAAPPANGARAEYVIIELDPDAKWKEANRGNNVFALRIAESNPLSFELQTTAPIANTRMDRVELWLRNNRSLINAEAKSRNIAPEAIAGIIAWEALNNVKPAPDMPSYGVGKVHAFELSGESLAVAVERLGYVPNLFLLQRIEKLKTVAGSIKYIGGILDAFSDIAESVGSQAKLRTRAEILATLYQGISRNNVPVRLNNAADYFKEKVRTGESYSPNAEMGTWVSKNIAFLKRALQ